MAAVLIAEDETILRFDLVDHFEAAGLRTIEARTGDEALKLLERHPDICCLFTDVQMPGSIDGLMLADIVSRRWPDKIIVIGSGRTEPERMLEGAVFMHKPYDLARLTGMISYMAGSSASTKGVDHAHGLSSPT